MKRWILGLVLLAVPVVGYVAWRSTRWKPYVPEAMATFTTESVSVDGKLDEAGWERATPITRFMIPETFAEPVSKTNARLLWDRDYLYVGFQASDRDIWGYLRKHDDGTCSEDVLEVFVQPDPEEGSYYNFEVNALGTCLDGWIPKGKQGLIGRGVLWNCPGVRTAVQVKGELNNWHDEDQYWQLEIAIPFASLPTLEGRRPEPGDVWKFHLARYDYSVYLPGEGRELTSCAPLSEENFHLHREWIPLRFKR